MIIEALIFVLITVANFFLTAFSTVIDFGSGFIEYDTSTGLGIVFGNLMAFNTILPITEALALALAALTFKAAILGFEIFMFTWGFMGRVKNFFISWR